MIYYCIQYNNILTSQLCCYILGDESGTTPFEMYNLEGSLFKWANEGRPMINVNNVKTPYAHPYHPVFGKLLDSSLRRDKVQDT
jgi:hypothetical protein